MKLTKMIALGLALSLNAMAADSTATGTITFSGTFSPKVQSVEIALYDCGTDASLTECQADAANPANFGSFDKDASLNLGNNLNEEVRYVAYRVKAKMFLFKNDSLEIKTSLHTEDSKIDVAFENMKLESVGSSFGQDYLGNLSDQKTSGDFLLEDALLLNSSDQTFYTSAANGYVLSAMTDASALYANGVISISTDELATSDGLNTKINLSFTARDL